MHEAIIEMHHFTVKNARREFVSPKHVLIIECKMPKSQEPNQAGLRPR